MGMDYTDHSEIRSDAGRTNVNSDSNEGRHGEAEYVHRNSG